MPYIASKPETFKGISVGTGQCVAFVEAAAKTPTSFFWRQGKKVTGGIIVPGTAIATFLNGKYRNRMDGTSHAAIFLNQTQDGIYVLDQWNHHGHRQVVHERLIHFRGAKWHGKLVDNAESYYVIE